MVAQKESKTGNTPRDVIRGVNSHKRNNEVGVHWLRISFPRQYLKRVRLYCERYFGQSSQDGYGLWSYDTRYSWPNGTSLNFDSDFTRSEEIHQGKVTLDVPGKALDIIAQGDLHLFIVGLGPLNPVCTRCDIFFDDYQRVIKPAAMKKIIDKKDFSGFREVQFKKRWGTRKGRYGVIHDEVDFGRRGGNGCGKYLRVYDKTLESEGEIDCIRWEVEFSKERSHKVLEKLSQVTSIDAFATLCGSLVAGAIVFVHRSSEKNIGRLVIYDFWIQIRKTLGSLVIRVEKKKSDIACMHKYIFRQVSPTMATLRFTFVDDTDFLNWMIDVLDDGELRMSQRQHNLARANKRTLRYSDGVVVDNDGVLVA